MRTSGTIERLAFLAAISAPLCAAQRQPNAHPQFPRFLNTTSSAVPSITSSTTSSSVVSDSSTLTDSTGTSSTSSDGSSITSSNTITSGPSTTTPFPTTGTEAVGGASSISGVLVGLFPAISSWSASPVPSVASMVKSEADKVKDQLNDVLERTGSTAQPCSSSKRRDLLSDLVGFVSQALCDVDDVTSKVTSNVEGLTQSQIDDLVKGVEDVQGEIENIAKTLPETIEEDEKNDDDQSSTSDDSSTESSTTSSSASCSASNGIDEFVTCYSTTTENSGSTVSTTTCETVTSTISGCSLEPTTSSTFVSSSTQACYVVSASASLFDVDGTQSSWTGGGYETICEWPSSANDVGAAPATWVAVDKEAQVDAAWQDAVGYAQAKIWPASYFATQSSGATSSSAAPGSSVTSSIPSATASSTSSSKSSAAPSSSSSTTTSSSLTTMSTSTKSCSYSTPQVTAPYCSNIVQGEEKKNKCTCTDDKAFQPYTAGCRPVCPIDTNVLDGYTEITSATPTPTSTTTTPSPSPTLIAQDFKQCYSGSEYKFDQSDVGDLIDKVCGGVYFEGDFSQVWDSGDIQLYDGSGDKTDDAKFTIDIMENDQACPEGSSLEREYATKLNSDVCKDHLTSVVDGCAPFTADDDSPLMKGGGILYANCLTWELRVDAS